MRSLFNHGADDLGLLKTCPSGTGGIGGANSGADGGANCKGGGGGGSGGGSGGGINL